MICKLLPRSSKLAISVTFSWSKHTAFSRAVQIRRCSSTPPSFVSLQSVFHRWWRAMGLPPLPARK
eukprot:571629-Pyramimonas_sp.AAC.1